MPEPFITVIIEAVARHYSVDPRSILSEERFLSQARARHTAMYVTRLAGHFSFPQIGEAFNRDHTTIMTACRKMALQAASDPIYKQVIEALVSEVHGLGLKGGPVKIRPEIWRLLEERVQTGIYGKTVEDEVDRILCDYFQRLERK